MAKTGKYIVLNHGEKLLILIERYIAEHDADRPTVARLLGWTATYLPTMCKKERLNQRQIRNICQAFEIPESVFEDETLALCMKKVEILEAKIDEHAKRIRLLEAENAGLRNAYKN